MISLLSEVLEAHGGLERWRQFTRLSWGWGNTSGEPLIIFGLPAGPHKLEITLVNPNHQPLGRSVVEFVIPPRDAAPKSH